MFWDDWDALALTKITETQSASTGNEEVSFFVGVQHRFLRQCEMSVNSVMTNIIYAVPYSFKFGCLAAKHPVIYLHGCGSTCLI